MERRRALCALGTYLATLAGCVGLESGERSRESEADDGVGDGSSGPEATPKATRQFSTVGSYSARDITLEVAREDLPAGWQAPWHVAVFTRQYPRGPVLQVGVTEPTAGIDGTARTVSVDLEQVPEGSTTAETQERDKPSADAPTGSAHHVAELRNGPVEGPGKPGMGPVVAETDRFRFDADGGIVPDPHPETLGDSRRGGFSRTAREGDYRLSIRCQDPEIRVPVRVFKSECVRARTAWHGPGYRRYVEGSVEGEPSERLSKTIAATAAVLDADPLSLAIDVVQSLPYRPETVDSGADEYIKYPAETLVDGGGDCEDTAILLASLLQVAPSERDCALVHPPDHMGVGIAGDGFVGTYYRRDGTEYFYVETTGIGWEVGELPEKYADAPAKVYPV